MIEKHILLDTYDLQRFYGLKEENLNAIVRNSPKLKIFARGDSMKIVGEEAEIKSFEKKLESIINYLDEYKTISPGEIQSIFNNSKELLKNVDDDVLLYNASGRAIKARNANQRRIISEFETKDLLFATGPAGTGKTYIAIALGVKALKEMRVQKIILSRPAVEAGENLGFLPGDLREKLDPYLQPLYDALLDMIPYKKLEKYLEEKVVQIAPLAFMRGRTLNNAFVILDEAQNANHAQLKMFLTRMGENAKFIVTGDMSQIDLPRKEDSGLLHAKEILKNINDIAFIDFNKNDIIRHKIVSQIVEAYELSEKKS